MIKFIGSSSDDRFGCGTLLLGVDVKVIVDELGETKQILTESGLWIDVYDVVAIPDSNSTITFDL